MNAVDTNVLLYVHDSRDPVKQAKADSLVRSLLDGVLLWQVACEYIAASRKLVPLGYSQANAFDDIRDLQKYWGIVVPNWQVYERAEQLIQRFSLSFCDALIVAA